MDMAEALLRAVNARGTFGIEAVMESAHHLSGKDIDYSDIERAVSAGYVVMASKKYGGASMRTRARATKTLVLTDKGKRRLAEEEH